MMIVVIIVMTMIDIINLIISNNNKNAIFVTRIRTMTVGNEHQSIVVHHLLTIVMMTMTISMEVINR